VNEAPEVSLPRFAGPLDLLLALVRKNEIAIADLPVAEITRQYLDYLRQAKEFNIELGADFVYMAATLIDLKSRSLVPAGSLPPEVAAEDPRQELVRQLLDHEQLCQAAEFLEQKLEVEQSTWSHSPELAVAPSVEIDEEIAVSEGALNLLQVLRLAQQALATARAYDQMAFAASVSVAEMRTWLEQRLALQVSPLEAGPLLEEQPDAAHRSAVFLAMLEMANSSRIQLKQQECFGPIWIHQTVYGPTVP
jgi:segregation and condensation protein A